MNEMILGGAAAVDADLIKDSDTKSFMVDVVEASKSVPVLVDFWAPWCGPCKTLGPILEKLTREGKGKIKLVKVDIDKNPEVASQMRVQSIPAVFASPWLVEPSDSTRYPRWAAAKPAAARETALLPMT